MLSRELVKMLSIRVADAKVTRVGLVIKGYREFEYKICKKSAVREEESLLNRLML